MCKNSVFYFKRKSMLLLFDGNNKLCNLLFFFAIPFNFKSVWQKKEFTIQWRDTPSTVLPVLYSELLPISGVCVIVLDNVQKENICNPKPSKNS